MTQSPTTPEGEPEQEAAPETPPQDAPAEAPSGEAGAAAPEATPEEPAPVEVDEVAALQAALDERTADLQRIQADFVNYKRRVERDRILIEQNATYRVLTPIIDVLDTIDRAREHGDLDEGFTAVADQLESVVTKLGLSRFGTVGDPFDPNLHDALSHIGEDPEVEVTTCKVVVKSGYRIGDRVLRAAQVLVVDPATPAG